MTAVSRENKTVTYPIVTGEINGLMRSALLDTGAGISYAPSTLIDKVGINPIRRELKRIEMTFRSSYKAVDIFDLSITSFQSNFQLDAQVSQVERSELLTIENWNYADVVMQFSHPRSMTLNDDDDKKSLLPVHLILETNEVTKIKTGTKLRTGWPGEPVAELRQFRQTIQSPGKDADITEVLLPLTSSVDYEELCRLDDLGLKDSPSSKQETVHGEFKAQLTCSPKGWYETSLPWKGNHPPLPDNHEGSLKPLKSLISKLEKQGELERYNRIIQDQISKGIMEYGHEKV